VLAGAKGKVAMDPQIVTYKLDDKTKAEFEIDPLPGFRPASAEETAGRVRDAIVPAVETAKVVLDKVKENGPHEVCLKFDIKVSGKADWLVARVATEGNFEDTLTWKDKRGTDQSHTSSP
jgi:Trypsin-co-occurring domain 1